MIRARILTVLLACAGLLAGCGSEAPAPVRWMEAKPNPIVDSLRAAVVARPAPDRVRLEAHWTATAVAGPCTIDLGLPAGVLIVEGAERIEVDAQAPAGHASWVLEFPRDGRELDAVVRYCVETPDGLRAAQCAVRLTPAH
ncbi:MAG: hypothetical protein P1V36_01055 [Planctomycetota bacterium]|nr:hypothetical protein [Planctomycetota bacterium]